MSDKLRRIVLEFAQSYHDLPEHILNNEGWGWDAYKGVRYAFLHMTLSLRQLAAEIESKRSKEGLAPSEAQRLLAQHQAAVRDFQALLVGVDEESFVAEPAPEEWPIRQILVHVHSVERYFFATILHALRNPGAKQLRGREDAEFLGEPAKIADQLSLPETWVNYEQLHQRVIAELANLDEVDLATLALMWEPSALPVRFRIARFAAHLREHTNQLEKTLGWLKQPPNEAKLLIRQMFAALAEVEGACIGTANHFDAACDQLADRLSERLASFQTALDDIDAMLTAVKANDVAGVSTMLTANPGLAYLQFEDGQSALLQAIYNGRQEMAALLTKDRELSFFEAAAIGNLNDINIWLEWEPPVLQRFARDGFTALQLAAFFGHPSVVRRLLDAGANLHAVARNAMRIQPIHAAVAGRNLEIVQMLVAAGADVNAKQQDNFTPLMGALQNGDQEIEAVLRQAGAVA